MSNVKLSVRQRTEHLLQNRMFTVHEFEKIRCNCTHSNITADSRIKDGYYICPDCQKKVRTYKIHNKKIDSAIETIDNMIDIIKLSLDMTHETSQKEVRRLAKDLKMLYQLRALYENGHVEYKKKRRRKKFHDKKRR